MKTYQVRLELQNRKVIYTEITETDATLAFQEALHQASLIGNSIEDLTFLDRIEVIPKAR